MSVIYEFFARPEPTLGLALCRVLLGLVLAVDGMRVLADHDRFYGDRPGTLRPPAPLPLPRCLDIFGWAARLGLGSRPVLGLLVVSALAFALGVWTTVAGAVLLLVLVAIPARNIFIVYGGDAFARTLVLLLLFSPCDQSLSLSRGTWGLDAVAAPWAGRLIQIEIIILYVYNYVAKAGDPAWRGRTALFDLLRNRNFARGRMPGWFLHPRICAAMTEMALQTELLLPLGLVFSPTATVACCAAVVFHLGIAWCVDVHLFSFITIAGLAACLPASLWPGPTVSVDAAPLSFGTAAALALCLAYVAYAILWDFPRPGRITAAVRRALGPLVDKIYWERGWQLFVEGCRHEYQVEVVSVDADGIPSRRLWDRPDHRTQRFKFSTIRDPRARAVLVQRIRDELPPRTRAFSVGMIVIDVRTRDVVHGIHFDALMADFDACALLASTVQCPPTHTMLSELVESRTR